MPAASQLLLGQPVVLGLGASATGQEGAGGRLFARTKSCCLFVSRIGLYESPGRAGGEGPLQTPKGQVEEEKGEARMEEEPNRASNVGAGSWERLCVQVLLYLLICLLSQPRGVLALTLQILFPMPLPGSEPAVLSQLFYGTWLPTIVNQMGMAIRAEFTTWGEDHPLSGSLRACLSLFNTLGCSWSPVGHLHREGPRYGKHFHTCPKPAIASARGAEG